jgi:superfamily II DNA helicase RecQ
MIAHNDSLMQIAILQVKSKEDLLKIKGFGEKRAEKYGDEILRVLDAME